MQPLESAADAYTHPPYLPTMPQQNQTYLKVTTLTVAPNGWFPRHLSTSSDMDGLPTCITGDLPGI
jgi:hypothetical protein